MSFDPGSFPEPPPPPAGSRGSGAGGAAFWADVLRPALNAFAPTDRRRVMARVRNAAAAFVGVALLLPPHAPLGTGTPEDARWIAGAFGLLAVLAFAFRKHEHGPWIAAGGAVVVGAAVEWIGRGALWGWGFAGLAVASVALSRARVRWLRLPPPPEEPDPHPPNRGGVPRLLHFVGSTLAIVMILRVFAVQTMNVPTGSMQPTIMGNRAERGASGDWLLVDNGAYVAREPRRWEIVAFLYPLDSRVNFVKRLLGLPGETVEFRAGDLYVDGQIARKPPLVQEQLWTEIWPRPGPFAKPRPVTSGWSASEDDGWRRDGEHGLALRARGARRMRLARFSKRLRQDQSDLRLSLHVESDAGALVRLEIESRGRHVSLDVRVPPAAAAPPESDERAGAGLRAGPEGSPVPLDLRRGPVRRLALGVADGRATAFVDGHPVATADLPPARGRTSRVRFGADGPARFRDIRVETDIHYTAPKPTYEVPADGFFVVGDNLRFSVDSRKWVVTEFHVKGRSEPLRAAEQTVDALGRPVPNVARKDGRYRFVDVDGLARDLGRDDVERVVRGVPLPFVRRDRLIGRPVLIVWPWSVHDAGFRPRVLP